MFKKYFIKRKMKERIKRAKDKLVNHLVSVKCFSFMHSNEELSIENDKFERRMKKLDELEKRYV